MWLIMILFSWCDCDVILCVMSHITCEWVAYPGADPEFPVKGGADPPGVAPTYD